MGMKRVTLHNKDTKEKIQVWPVDVDGWLKSGKWEVVKTEEKGKSGKTEAPKANLRELLQEPKSIKVDDAVALIKVSEDVELLEKVLDLGEKTYKGILDAVEDRLDDIDPEVDDE